MKNVFSKISYAFAVAALVVTASQSASALEYRFKFKVTSSGPDMYACNAGLRTIPLNCDVCYKENSDGTKTPIERPGNCSNAETNCGSRIKCVSRGGSNGEAYMNYLTAGSRAWTDHSAAPSALRPLSIRGAPSAFQQITSNAAAMQTVIGDLVFELGSEVYSAQYFVDVCYRAPDHPYVQDGIAPNYSITSNVNSVDYLSTGRTFGDNNRTNIVLNTTELNRYTKAAGVKVQAFLACDIQTGGEYVAGVVRADFVIGADGIPTGATNGGYFYASSMQNLTGDAIDLIPGRNVLNLRSCKVRYLYTETKGLNCNGGSTVFRDWTRKGAEMCTSTIIDETVTQ